MMSTMAIADMSGNQLSDLVLKGINAEMAAMFERKIRAEIEPMIKSMATDLAKNVVAKLAVYHKDTLTDAIQVHVQFGEKK